MIQNFESVAPFAQKATYDLGSKFRLYRRNTYGLCKLQTVTDFVMPDDLEG